MGRRKRCSDAPATPMTRLSGEDRRRIENEVNSLMTRHVVAHPCPLDVHQLAALWVASGSKAEQEAFRAMSRWWELEGAQERTLNGFTVSSVPLQFEDARLMLQIPAALTHAKLPVWARSGLRYVVPESVLGKELGAKLEEWCKRSVHTYTRCRATQNMVATIMGLSNTVGQIQRMAPDLVKYVGMQKQAAACEQVRRSSLPDAWMEVDRLDLQVALDHLGLCYILKPLENNVTQFGSPTPFSHVHSDLWAWDFNSIGNSHWENAQAGGGEAGLSAYHLPRTNIPTELGTFRGLKK